ncbi:MAG TPA: ATP-binding protein [Methylomirabilota bacterium]|nr:ATP-binding protein [Methylomirabilota bacterium]
MPRTRFTTEAQTAPPPAAAPDVVAEQSEEIPESKVNILMVDDTPENLVALEAILGDLGQNLIKAHSGEEALRLLLKHDFAVILMDVNMTGLNGFETATLIRQRKNSEHTPIIFVTAISTSETHIFKGYSIGAVDYIFTPVIPEVLRTKVSVFVELLKKTEAVKRQAEQLRTIEEQEHKRHLAEASERLELQTKRNRFFTLSVNLLAIASFEGYFKQLNPVWAKTLGYTEAELMARPFFDFLVDEDREATLSKIQEMSRSDAPIYFEAQCHHKDGSVRCLDWTAAPYGAEQLIYLFARDVTERKVAERKIQKLNAELGHRAAELQKTNEELQQEIATREKMQRELQESNAALEAFSYSVSHDLRAPVRAMQGFARVLLEDYSDVLDEAGRDYAERIVGAAGKMDHLIQDLLIYSRLGHTSLSVHPTDLERIVEDALAQLSADIRERQATITLKRPLHAVFAHATTLEQVVGNLISNGIKFVPDGVKPEITIWTEMNEGLVRLSVKDNGIGIAPEHHARIFRVFERLHAADDYPGTGIGLAIVRKGIERMGGQIGITSEIGKGSCFWIELRKA